MHTTRRCTLQMRPEQMYTVREQGNHFNVRPAVHAVVRCRIRPTKTYLLASLAPLVPLAGADSTPRGPTTTAAHHRLPLLHYRYLSPFRLPTATSHRTYSSLYTRMCPASSKNKQGDNATKTGMSASLTPPDVAG